MCYSICIVHSTLKCAEQDLSNLRKTIEAMPLTFDQYKEQEAELVAFLANSSNPVDWNQRGLAAQPVVCEFDNSAGIEKAVKVGLKFVSAEEEAAQRKADLEALARRNESAAVAEGKFAFASCFSLVYVVPVVYFFYILIQVKLRLREAHQWNFLLLSPLCLALLVRTMVLVLLAPPPPLTRSSKSCPQLLWVFSAPPLPAVRASTL